jgi:hypothetical protein
MPHPRDDAILDDPLVEYAGELPDVGRTGFALEPRKTSYPGYCSICDEPTSTKGARYCTWCRNGKVARLVRRAAYLAVRNRKIREWFESTEA